MIPCTIRKKQSTNQSIIDQVKTDYSVEIIISNAKVYNLWTKTISRKVWQTFLSNKSRRGSGRVEVGELYCFQNGRHNNNWTITPVNVQAITAEKEWSFSLITLISPLKWETSAANVLGKLKKWNNKVKYMSGVKVFIELPLEELQYF